MDLILGAGKFRYRPKPDWAKLPDGWRLTDAAAVGVDRQDNVYVFARNEHPMMVFDRNGTFLTSWGEGTFVRPHGISMSSDDTILCTDDGDHSVRKCALDGTVLLTIGVPGKPSAYQSGNPFNRCTHTALSPSGDIYISDGYGNAKVHRFSPDGRYVASWGEPGTGPGEFNVPHNITCDDAGRVLVADRENHRVQVFDGQGQYQGEWRNLHRPSGLYTARGQQPLSYVAEIGPYLPGNIGWPNVGPRLSVLSSDGAIVARIATTPSGGNGLGQFVSPHGIAVDSRGDIYVSDVAHTGWPSLFPDTAIPDKLPCIQKLERVE